MVKTASSPFARFVKRFSPKGGAERYITPGRLLQAAVALVGVIVAHFVALLASHVAQAAATRHLQQQLQSADASADASASASAAGAGAGAGADADMQKRSVAFGLVGTMVYWATIVALLLVIMAIVGVRTTAVVAVLGAVLFAVGLGLQGTLGDVAAGMMLLAAGTFRIGDYIEVPSQGVRGRVKDFSIIYTQVAQTETGVRSFVPNRVLYGSVVINHSAGAYHLAVVRMTVSNRNDARTLAAAMAAVRDVVAAYPTVLAVPPPACGVAGVEAFGTVLILRFALPIESFFTHGTTSRVTEIVTRAREALLAAGVLLVDLPPAISVSTTSA